MLASQVIWQLKYANVSMINAFEYVSPRKIHHPNSAQAQVYGSGKISTEFFLKAISGTHFNLAFIGAGSEHDLILRIKYSNMCFQCPPKLQFKHIIIIWKNV